MMLSAAVRSCALGLALLGALAPVAQAGRFWKRHGSHEKVVEVPAQRVVVETRAADVTYREGFRVSRGVTVPLLGAFYLPAAYPILGLGVGVGDRVQRSADDLQWNDNPLRSTHAAELAQLRYERARAIATADVQAAQRAVTRSAAPAGTTRDASTELDEQIKELSDRIDKLEERISAVEKLTLIHDNYLREQIQKKGQ